MSKYPCLKTILWHHQDDLEGQECHQHGVVMEIGCLYGIFAILTWNMVPFWNPQDHGDRLGSISRHHVYHQDDLEAQECPLTGVLVEIGCLDGGFAILTSHNTPLRLHSWASWSSWWSTWCLDMLPVHCPGPEDSIKVS